VSFIVNTQPKGDFFLEMDDQQNLYVSVQDADTLKLQYPGDKIIILRGDEPFVPLSALLDVTWTFDEKKLTVSVIGKTTESGKTATDLFALRAAAKNIYFPRETSAFVNYGLNYNYASHGGFQSFSVSNKVGFHTGDVFWVSDSLYTKTDTEDSWVRLQSNATYERREDLQWLVLGDQYANSGELGSTLNMGGVGFSKVYRLDPYFITQPVMDLSGSVIFPTEAEIYLDGVLIKKEQISPGLFELKNLYSYTGSHNVEVLLKDPFGNVQKISYLAYFSSQMLRKGLHEYSYNVGWLREFYGAKSNEYGDAAFSLFHRYGVTNNFNVGIRAEGTEGLYNGGLQMSFAIPRFGFLSASASGSSMEGNVLGGAFSLQHALQSGKWNTNLLLRAFTRDYATVGARPAADSKQFEVNAGIGFILDPIGSFSVNYSASSTFQGIDTKVFSVNYSRSLYKSISLFFTGSATKTTDADTNYSCFAGLNFSLTDKIRASAQASGGSGDVNSETLQIQQDQPVGEGLGYRASLNRSESPANIVTSLNPHIQYNARYGILSADAVIQDAQRGNTAETYNVSLAGSLVYVGGFFGVSRPVNDSFGVVAFNQSVPGAAVLNNGQDIGKTGRFSTMVIPTLTAYGQNKVMLDTKNIPMDYSVTDVNKTLSPSVWSGSCIYFDVQQVRALTGVLFVQKEGRKVPLEYVEVTLKVGEKKITFPTGRGGEFYVENLLALEPEKGSEAASPPLDKQSCRVIKQIIQAGGNVIAPGTYDAFVDSEEGRCEFSLTFPKNGETITEVGEILCAGVHASAGGVKRLDKKIEAEARPSQVFSEENKNPGLPMEPVSGKISLGGRFIFFFSPDED
jgi:outer membrane usher protein FimD/PapC